MEENKSPIEIETNRTFNIVDVYNPIDRRFQPLITAINDGMMTCSEYVDKSNNQHLSLREAKQSGYLRGHEHETRHETKLVQNTQLIEEVTKEYMLHRLVSSTTPGGSIEPMMNNNLDNYKNWKLNDCRLSATNLKHFIIISIRESIIEENYIPLNDAIKKGIFNIYTYTIHMTNTTGMLHLFEGIDRGFVRIISLNITAYSPPWHFSHLNIFSVRDINNISHILSDTQEMISLRDCVNNNNINMKNGEIQFSPSTKPRSMYRLNNDRSFLIDDKKTIISFQLCEEKSSIIDYNRLKCNNDEGKYFTNIDAVPTQSKLRSIKSKQHYLTIISVWHPIQTKFVTAKEAVRMRLIDGDYGDYYGHHFCKRLSLRQLQQEQHRQMILTQSIVFSEKLYDDHRKSLRTTQLQAISSVHRGLTLMEALSYGLVNVQHGIVKEKFSNSISIKICMEQTKTTEFLSSLSPSTVPEISSISTNSSSLSNLGDVLVLKRPMNMNNFSLNSLTSSNLLVFGRNRTIFNVIGVFDNGKGNYINLPQSIKNRLISSLSLKQLGKIFYTDHLPRYDNGTISLTIYDAIQLQYILASIISCQYENDIQNILRRIELSPSSESKSATTTTTTQSAMNRGKEKNVSFKSRSLSSSDISEFPSSIQFLQFYDALNDEMVPIDVAIDRNIFYPESGVYFNSLHRTYHRLDNLLTENRKYCLTKNHPLANTNNLPIQVKYAYKILGMNVNNNKNVYLPLSTILRLSLIDFRSNTVTNPIDKKQKSIGSAIRSGLLITKKIPIYTHVKAQKKPDIDISMENPPDILNDVKQSQKKSSNDESSDVEESMDRKLLDTLQRIYQEMPIENMKYLDADEVDQLQQQLNSTRHLVKVYDGIIQHPEELEKSIDQLQNKLDMFHKRTFPIDSDHNQSESIDRLPNSDVSSIGPKVHFDPTPQIKSGTEITSSPSISPSSSFLSNSILVKENETEHSNDKSMIDNMKPIETVNSHLHYPLQNIPFNQPDNDDEDDDVSSISQKAPIIITINRSPTPSATLVDSFSSIPKESNDKILPGKFQDYDGNVNEILSPEKFEKNNRKFNKESLPEIFQENNGNFDEKILPGKFQENNDKFEDTDGNFDGHNLPPKFQENNGLIEANDGIIDEQMSHGKFPENNGNFDENNFLEKIEENSEDTYSGKDFYKHISVSDESDKFSTRSPSIMSASVATLTKDTEEKSEGIGPQLPTSDFDMDNDMSTASNLYPSTMNDEESRGDDDGEVNDGSVSSDRKRNGKSLEETDDGIGLNEKKLSKENGNYKEYLSLKQKMVELNDTLHSSIVSNSTILQDLAIKSKILRIKLANLKASTDPVTNEPETPIGSIGKEQMQLLNDLITKLFVHCQDIEKFLFDLKRTRNKFSGESMKFWKLFNDAANRSEELNNLLKHYYEKSFINNRIREDLVEYLLELKSSVGKCYRSGSEIIQMDCIEDEKELINEALHLLQKNYMKTEELLNGFLESNQKNDKIQRSNNLIQFLNWLNDIEEDLQLYSLFATSTVLEKKRPYLTQTQIDRIRKLDNQLKLKSNTYESNMKWLVNSDEHQLLRHSLLTHWVLLQKIANQKLIGKPKDKYVKLNDDHIIMPDENHQTELSKGKLWDKLEKNKEPKEKSLDELRKEEMEKEYEKFKGIIEKPTEEETIVRPSIMDVDENVENFREKYFPTWGEVHKMEKTDIPVEDDKQNDNELYKERASKDEERKRKEELELDEEKKRNEEEISDRKSPMTEETRLKTETDLEHNDEHNNNMDKETLKKDQLNKENLKKENLEKETLKKDQLEKDIMEKDQLEKDNLEKENLEKETLIKDQLEKDQLEKENLKKENLDKDSLDKDNFRQDSLEDDIKKGQSETLTDPELKNISNEVKKHDAETEELEKKLDRIEKDLEDEKKGIEEKYEKYIREKKGGDDRSEKTLSTILEEKPIMDLNKPLLWKEMKKQEEKLKSLEKHLSSNVPIEDDPINSRKVYNFYEDIGRDVEDVCDAIGQLREHMNENELNSFNLSPRLQAISIDSINKLNVAKNALNRINEFDRLAHVLARFLTDIEETTLNQIEDLESLNELNSRLSLVTTQIKSLEKEKEMDFNRLEEIAKEIRQENPDASSTNEEICGEIDETFEMQLKNLKLQRDKLLAALRHVYQLLEAIQSVMEDIDGMKESLNLTDFDRGSIEELMAKKRMEVELLSTQIGMIENPTDKIQKLLKSMEGNFDDLILKIRSDIDLANIRKWLENVKESYLSSTNQKTEKEKDGIKRIVVLNEDHTNFENALAQRRESLDDLQKFGNEQKWKNEEKVEFENFHDKLEDTLSLWNQVNKECQERKKLIEEELKFAQNFISKSENLISWLTVIEEDLSLGPLKEVGEAIKMLEMKEENLNELRKSYEMFKKKYKDSYEGKHEGHLDLKFFENCLDDIGEYVKDIGRQLEESKQVPKVNRIFNMNENEDVRAMKEYLQNTRSDLEEIRQIPLPISFDELCVLKEKHHWFNKDLLNKEEFVMATNYGPLIQLWNQVKELSDEHQAIIEQEIRYVVEDEKFAEKFDYNSWIDSFRRYLSMNHNRVHECFRCLDKNRDNHLDHYDFIDGILDCGFPSSPKELLIVAKYLDKNDDGFIDYLEFINGLKTNQQRAYEVTDNTRIQNELLRQSYRCSCVKRFPINQVSSDRLKIGNTTKLIRILRNGVMVRVGGGWEPLDSYVSKIDPCRNSSTSSTSIIHNQ
ncbi:hypothetical protein SNEBB_002081 [Seison nebaliae]|nr:hypothetical protein SNEBB_002081 [Seison nebaliae]